MLWVKLYTDILGDVKLTRAARRGLKGLALLPWFLAFAGEADDNGRLTINGEAADPEDIAPLIPGETVRTVTVALASCAAIGVLVRDADGAMRFNAWATRAGKPSDRPESARERKQRQREKERAEREQSGDTSRDASRVTTSEHVTPRHAGQGVTGPAGRHAVEVEEEEEAEGEEEKNKSLTAADAADAADRSAQPDALPASRRTRASTTPATPRPRKSKGEPAPWMAELAPVWRGVFGGDMPQGSATLLRPLITQHDVPSVAAHLAVYCRVRGSYGSVRDFVSKFGLYVPGGAEDQRHERETAKDAARAPLAAAAGDGVTRGPRPGVSMAPLTVWR